ncbi:MAG: glycosyltransferase [Algibacter sp.]|uniref:glycosyltransferase n=1 Tax=Algibacter sp. TaxID=1872428 RepID=UPI003298B313
MIRIGVIIVCHNIENNINTDLFVKNLNQAKNLELCFVNNASKDNTYQILKEIKELSKIDFSILDIKRNKSDISAVRSGSRFMFNQFNLNHIGYVSTKVLNKKEYGICGLIKHIRINQNFILRYSKELKERSKIKQTMFQTVFSIKDYLDKLNNTN